MALLNRSKNFIINGAMDFWQRGTSFAAIANATYSADRFQYVKTGTMVHTVSRDTDVPTTTQASAIFPYSYRANLTTPQTSIGTGDFCAIAQKIEGNNISLVYGRTVTLSFWVKATTTGTYAVSFRNSDFSRSMVRTYTISTTNTWEKKTMTLTLDTSGTWLSDTGVGLYVSFVLAAGTTLQTSTLNTWLSGNFLSTSTAVNGVNTGATDLRITGIQLEESSEASNFERAGRTILDELTLCQRYYEKTYNINTVPGTVDTAGSNVFYEINGGVNSILRSVFFRTPKRTTPSLRAYSPVTGAVDQVRSNDSAADRPATYTYQGEFGAAVSFSPSVTSRVTHFHWTADAEL